MALSKLRSCLTECTLCYCFAKHTQATIGVAPRSTRECKQARQLTSTLLQNQLLPNNYYSTEITKRGYPKQLPRYPYKGIVVNPAINTDGDTTCGETCTHWTNSHSVTQQRNRPQNCLCVCCPITKPHLPALSLHNIMPWHYLF